MAAKIQDGRRRPQNVNFDYIFLFHMQSSNLFQTLFVSVEYLEFLNIILLFLF